MGGGRPPRRMKRGYHPLRRRHADTSRSFGMANPEKKRTRERPEPRMGASEPVEQSRAANAPARDRVTARGGAAMERGIEWVAGLDVHKKTVAACLRGPGSHGERRQEVRTLGTTAAELLALRDWLEAQGVTHVAMESTGVYWKPIFYVLE